MKNPDAVFRELGQLFDFQRQLAKFRFRKRHKSNKAAAPDRETAPPISRSSVPGG
jgi:hypothetical protein